MLLRVSSPNLIFTSLKRQIVVTVLFFIFFLTDGERLPKPNLTSPIPVENRPGLESFFSPIVSTVNEFASLVRWFDDQNPGKQSAALIFCRRRGIPIVDINFSQRYLTQNRSKWLVLRRSS